MCKIKINMKEKALVHSKTGDILRPSCFDDLVAVHSYLVGFQRVKEADKLLKRVFEGEMVITNMIEKAQKAIK